MKLELKGLISAGELSFIDCQFSDGIAEAIVPFTDMIISTISTFCVSKKLIIVFSVNCFIKHFLPP